MVSQLSYKSSIICNNYLFYIYLCITDFFILLFAELKLNYLYVKSSEKLFYSKVILT